MHLLDESCDGPLFVAQLLRSRTIDVVCGDAPALQNPCPAYCCALDKARAFQGLHGAHQVAQKLITSALPLVTGQRNLLAAEVFEGEGGRGACPERGKKLERAVAVACGGNQFALRSRGQKPLGGLLAILPIGPAGPRKSSQDEQNGSDNQCVALSPEMCLLDLLYEPTAARAPIVAGRDNYYGHNM